jgi:2-furoyl-CoA dehydrogenase 2Fe-2S iron sulfur subunit
MFAVQAVGRQIVTVEGLSSANQDLTDIQKAFWERHGLQCGFCTAGILMSLEEYFSTEGNSYSEDEIKDVLSGHLCRCTGYQNIVRAALDIVSDRTLK